VVDAILDTMVHDDAGAGGNDVAVPVHGVAVGELSDESLGDLGQDQRRLVGAAGLAPDVTDERERPVTRAGDLACHTIQCVVQ
jgi:hypothetical protein